METINDKNYELWLVRYAEGDLTAAERQAVEAWLVAHPEAAEELRLYGEAPRLQRDESVRYAAAMPPQAKPLWSTGWRWAAAAAVLLLLLSPLVLPLFRSTEQPVQVAQTTPPVVAPMETDNAVIAPQPRVVARRIADEVVAPQQQIDYAENYASPLPLPLPEPTEPEVLLATAPEEPQMVYVDNLFVEDTTTDLEQQVLAVAESAREGLQGTWLGRRLARRLPDNDQLLAMTDNLRERTPQGIIMVADAIRVYRKSTK
ncbi:MAG: DUF4880 domain-containing protein [Bacteroidales bacterium]|nr:DUF4880 domain-containing protein [Bacteroidales bacterium]